MTTPMSLASHATASPRGSVVKSHLLVSETPVSKPLLSSELTRRVFAATRRWTRCSCMRGLNVLCAVQVEKRHALNTYLRDCSISGCVDADVFQGHYSRNRRGLKRKNVLRLSSGGRSGKYVRDLVQ